MELAIKIALMGGFLAILTMIHFPIDWIFQSHAEAMVKHNRAWIRAKHCMIYTLGFVPFMFILHFTAIEWFSGINILFWSHFVEDTYLPVYYWAKFIRRPPEMTQPRRQVGVDGYVNVLPPDPQAGFIDFIQTTLGKILMIVIDQIIHLLFLLPIAWMALQHCHVNP